MSAKGWRGVFDDFDVTDEIMEIAHEEYDEVERRGPVVWRDVWDRIDGKTLKNGDRIDLGNETSTPAMRHIQRKIREARR